MNKRVWIITSKHDIKIGQTVKTPARFNRCSLKGLLKRYDSWTHTKHYTDATYMCINVTHLGVVREIISVETARRIVKVDQL